MFFIKNINSDATDFYKLKTDKNLLAHFSPEHLKIEILDFIEFMKRSPIKDNAGGMGFWHSFAFYCFLKQIKPCAVIESGVYRGLSTWMIENVLPEARVLSIDPALSQRIYISESVNVSYSNIDFRYQDFSEFRDFNFKDVLLFFDDHNSHIDRLSHMAYFGFSRCLFDDNYYPHGDCLSLKAIIHKSAYNPLLEIGAGDDRVHLMYMREGLFLEENTKAVNFLTKRVETYTEFPKPLSNAQGASDQSMAVYKSEKDPNFMKLDQTIRNEIKANEFAYPVYVTINQL